MPYQASFFQLPCGARCSRVDASGNFSGEDAAALIKDWEAGGPLHGMPALVQTSHMTSASSDARRLFSRRPDPGREEPWVAVVVTNPMIRVTVNFVTRIQGGKKMKLFAGEEESIQWLDDRIREEMAAKAS